MSGPSSPASTAEQRRLAGRYLLREPVGRGGAGVVWKASDELLGRTVAIKECMLPPTVDDADRDKLLSRVMREARTAARLDHPALVTVFDVVQESGRPWIVMEYVESRSLSQVVRQDGPLPVAQVVDIGMTLLDALYVAHGAGVLHRDVKPANVLLTESGNVVLTDFGIAASTGDPTLTTSGMLLGSPSYMPPERARGEAATPDSDVWSWAATLYTLVEGTTPYSGDHPLAVLSAVADHRRRPMELAGPLEPLLAEILDSEPEERPGELAVKRRLERIRAELVSHGPTTTGGTPVRAVQTAAEKSAAERTARLSTRRPRRDQEEAAAAAMSAGAIEAPVAGEPDASESGPAAASLDAAAARHDDGPDAQKQGRRSRWRRRRDEGAAAGAAAGAGAAVAGQQDDAWDIGGLLDGEAQEPAALHRPYEGSRAASAEASAPPASPPTAPTQPEQDASLENASTEAAAAPAHTGAPAAAGAPADRVADRAADRAADLAPAKTRPEPETQTEPPPGRTENPTEPAASQTETRTEPARQEPVPREPVPPVAVPDQQIDSGRVSPTRADTSSAAPAATTGSTAAEAQPAGVGSDQPPYGTTRAAPGQRSPRRRAPLLLGLGALVVVAVVALALVLGGGGSDPKAVPGVQAPSAASSAGSGSGGSGSSASASSSSTARSGTGAAVPAGWTAYKDSKFGWSIAVPPGFRQVNDGTTNQTDFRDGSGRLLRVEIAPQAHASAIGDWRSYESSFARQVSSYQRIRIEPADGSDGKRAADWEFTFTDGGSNLHVLNRGVVDGRTAHALYWQTPASSWSDSTALRDQAFATFQPPPQ